MIEVLNFQAVKPISGSSQTGIAGRSIRLDHPRRTAAYFPQRPMIKYLTNTVFTLQAILRQAFAARR